MAANTQTRQAAIPHLEKARNKIAEKLVKQEQRLREHPTENARREVERLKSIKAPKAEITKANAALRAAKAKHGEPPIDIGIQINTFKTVISRLNDAIRNMGGKIRDDQDSSSEEIELEPDEIEEDEESELEPDEIEEDEESEADGVESD